MAHDFRAQAGELNRYRPRMILSPIQWAGYDALVDLKWDARFFDGAERENVPDDSSGVYTFVAMSRVADHPLASYLLYVGETTEQSFRDRFSQYLTEERAVKSKRPHVTDMLLSWKGYLWFFYAPISDTAEAIETETRLQQAWIPPFNKRFPTDIRDAIKILQ